MRKVLEVAGFLRARALVLGALVVVLLAGGCQLAIVGLVDDATGQLKSAVASCGAAVGDALARMPGGDERAKKFEAHWKARDAAMAGLMRYAESLDAIVSAGKSG